MVTDTQVKTGYKQSELGVIPSDWEYTNLGLVCSYKNGKSFESNIDKNGNFNLITLDSIDITGKLKKEHLKVKTNDNSLGKNDIIMILSDVAHGNFLGLTDVIPEDNRYVLNQRVGALKNIKEFLPHYLSRYINLHQKYFKRVGQGSNQQNLAKGDVLAFPVLKPSLSEQEKIMVVLSNIEKLVEKTDQLIEKKRNIKQGTMQELLTGKRRLPGFSGEWEEKALGEIGEITGAGIDKKIKKDETPIRLVNYMDVAHYDFIYSRMLNHWVTAPPAQAQRCSVREGDIFFTPSSETREDIGLCSVAAEDIPNAGYSYHVVRLRLTENWDRNFSAYIFKTKNFLGQTEQMCEGSGKRYVITLKRFRELTIKYPTDVMEQKAIASILVDMNKEIDNLNQQKEKYLDIKQGMMQQLLTGRIRLV